MNTDNKLIAEFMGYKLSEDGYYLLPLDLPQFRNSDHGEWCSQYEVSFAERYWEISETALDYNRSWDWLMPVIRKVYDVSDELIDLDLFDGTHEDVVYGLEDAMWKGDVEAAFEHMYKLVSLIIDNN